MSKLKYYTRLSDLSIYRWDMCYKDNDLRWLICAKEPTEIDITPEQRSELTKIHYELLCQFENLNLPLMQKKIDIAVRVIDFIKASLNAKDNEKLLRAGVIMQALIATDDPDIDWLFKTDIAETREQKLIMTDLAVRIENYNKQKQKEENTIKQTLEYQTAVIAESLGGLLIDIKKTSVLQFFAYKQRVEDKITNNG